MKILLTGANGYIGRRLKEKLLGEDVSLRLLARNPKSMTSDIKAEVFQGDSFDVGSLERALEGIDIVYYLIHSLQEENYRELDKLSAHNFLNAAIKQGVKRIVYLGGLGVKEHASTHLVSRIETGEILSSKPLEIETLWIRAGVIIGSGSSSFEIIRHLTEKLPVMVTPKWVKTLAQPIGVDDVISYLVSAKDIVLVGNIIVDIGSEMMTYKEMMIGCAHALGLKRWIFPLPILTIKLSSHWLNFFTPVPYSVARSLIEGLSSEVIIQNDNAAKYFPSIAPESYESAVKQAILEMEKNQVFSRWSDAGGGKDALEKEFKNDTAEALFLDRQKCLLDGVSKEALYSVFCSIGGDEGWFGYSWLWEIRGTMDKMIGGAGLNRGRRDTYSLRVGESVDFWRVEDLKKNERLLLRAQMKVPGKAWLEFRIKEDEFIQTAYFYPKGLFGRFYWFLLAPIHYLVFQDMIRSIMIKAKKLDEL
ncbi:SDR family oxidoreductase [Sulfurimonas sp.]|uniref:SDR family oxidoreductase n=1 Tax=Sulfurimonas sp. TaxID=2022749 RepID=UPI0025EFE611|nr:SDR family oxidoreductase [Sulfurimonas sp.]MBT5934519.1 SDR family oxidoreductase [Sulfurimonas sp.]